MADYRGPAVNKYNSTPRKVFDKAIDRLELKRQRDREDNINDLQKMIQQIKQLQSDVADLENHVRSHCEQLDREGGTNREHDTEEL